MSSRCTTTFKSEAVTNHSEKTKARSCERAFCYANRFQGIMRTVRNPAAAMAACGMRVRTASACNLGALFVG